MTYKNNSHIKASILRIDYPPIDNNIFLEILGKINAIDIFSKKVLNVQKNVSLQYDVDKNISVSNTIESNEYRFYNPDNNNCICITSTYVYFELTAYIPNQTLLSYVEKIYNEIMVKAQIQVLNRIGLRYINILDFNDKELKKNVEKEFLFFSNLLKKYQKKDNNFFLSEAISKMQITTDKYLLNIIFGRKNDNAGTKLIHNKFTLDYDCSTKYPQNNTSIEDLRTIITELHATICSSFERSVTESFKESLN